VKTGKTLDNPRFFTGHAVEKAVENVDNSCGKTCGHCEIVKKEDFDRDIFVFYGTTPFSPESSAASFQRVSDQN